MTKLLPNTIDGPKLAELVADIRARGVKRAWEALQRPIDITSDDDMRTVVSCVRVAMLVAADAGEFKSICGEVQNASDLSDAVITAKGDNGELRIAFDLTETPLYQPPAPPPAPAAEVPKREIVCDSHDDGTITGSTKLAIDIVTMENLIGDGTVVDASIVVTFSERGVVVGFASADVAPLSDLTVQMAKMIGVLVQKLTGGRMPSSRPSPPKRIIHLQTCGYPKFACICDDGTVLVPRKM